VYSNGVLVVGCATEENHSEPVFDARGPGLSGSITSSNVGT